MADCSASGTAIDRVIQLAVASSSARGGHGNGAAAAAAGGTTTRAISNFINGTASSAALTMGPYADSLVMGSGAGGQIMPMAPIQTLGGGHQPRHGMMTQYQMPAQGQMMSMHHHHTAPQQQNMMSMQRHHQQQHHHQQQRMMMMQQMQIQQSRMAAMVQYQNQQQQQYQQINVMEDGHIK